MPRKALSHASSQATERLTHVLINIVLFFAMWIQCGGQV